MSLLIRDATVITVEPRGHIFEPGAVYVEGARIVDVGPSDEVVRRHPTAARVIRSSRINIAKLSAIWSSAASG